MAQWTKPNLDGFEFARAVSAIRRRAEKQTKWKRLLDTYVSTDLTIRARTTDSQLVLGRRGTGKTHMFRFVQETLGSIGEVAYFIDCRTLGSGIIGPKETSEQIATKYFRSLLNEIGTQMLDMAIHMEAPVGNSQQKVLNIIQGLIKYMEPVSETSLEPTFNYRQITESLQAIISNLCIDHIFIIIDEWAQIPVSAQPYVAEYIKRAIMTIPEICIKLLAVSYQCYPSKQTKEGVIGIQRGADITDVLDFDSYLIHDENPKPVTIFFSQVLYNHLGAELNWDLQITAKEKNKRILDIFTQDKAFTELVRAAEGNCRDFLCIFSRAFWDGYRQHADAKAISIPHISEAAASWFESEKYVNIRDEELPNASLTYILNNIIKGYKSRTFMVEASKVQDEALIRLLNERVIHKLSVSYAHKDRPGERYELFSLDYGAYVRFAGTVNEPNPANLPLQPQLPFEGVVKVQEDEQQFIVPLDDKRSIRRIVFDPNAVKITKW